MGNPAIFEASIKQIHEMMKSGELTCEDLVNTFIRRIAAFDREEPGLNAVIALNPEATGIARDLDRKFRDRGLTGPLHGIPVLLKDNIDTTDLPTTGGSVCLAGHIPPSDAFITRKLRAAGALILAKVNLHEFAVWGETASSIIGQTFNPYDLTRTPGGSSGGTGAGIAAGFGTVGIGTDTVNSIRSPASANCLVGLRPTLGLVSRSGIIPYSLTQDTAGPITRTVEDAAILLDAICGYDPADIKTAWSAHHTGNSYTSRLNPCGLSGKRIGILHSFFGSGPQHAEVNDLMDQAIGRMQAAGATIINLDEEIDSNYLIDQISVHLYDLRHDLNGYLSCLGPSAPVHSLEEIAASGQHHPGIGDNIRTALSLSQSSPEYKDRLLRQKHLQDEVMNLIARYSLDAIAYPHQKRLVVPVGETQVDRNGVLSAVTGFPAITVPAGFSAPTDTAPLGVPAGIEFLAPPWEEARLLDIAYALEQAEPVRRPPKSTYYQL